MSVMNNNCDPDERIGLLSLLAVQPIQHAAAAHPALPIKALAGKARRSPNRLARIVNDFLADPSVH